MTIHKPFYSVRKLGLMSPLYMLSLYVPFIKEQHGVLLMFIRKPSFNRPRFQVELF